MKSGTMNMMSSGTSIEQRNIVFVPFNYVELDRVGKRPAIVISDNEFNLNSEDMIVCAITRNPKKVRYDISITTDDLEDGNLRHPSKIKTSKISTMKQSNILFKIGKLNEEKSKKVIENINKIIKIKS